MCQNEENAPYLKRDQRNGYCHHWPRGVPKCCHKSQDTPHAFCEPFVIRRDLGKLNLALVYSNSMKNRRALPVFFCQCSLRRNSGARRMRFPCLPPLFLVVLAFVPLLGYVSDFIRVFLFLNPACCIVVLLHNSRHIEEGINNLVAHDMREHACGFPTFLCPGNFIFLNKSYCLFFLLLVQ